MNWNVRLAYIQSITAAIGMGIVQVAFAVYVNLILGQLNVVLGILNTTSGFASTIFVFPSGYFADKYRRDLLIRMSVFFGIVSQFALIFSTSLGEVDIILIILFISQAFAGVAWGLSGPAGQALLADSIEPGDLSRVFAKMHFANFIAASIGPFIAAGLTLIFGNTWALETLKNLILFGAISTIIANLSIAFASDNKSLIGKIKNKSADSSKVVNAEGMKEEFPVVKFLGRSFSYNIKIPFIIVISGIIIGFGAGATVAFFPVLFTNPKIGYGLLPFVTYVIFGVTNIVSGIAGIFAQRIIPFFGRIGSMFLTQGTAILCLLGLVVNLFLYQNHYISFDVSIFLLVILFITRNALMNASGPISRSIVMDVVPPNTRAKWNSLETLAWGMFWSLSSSIGGYIVDNFGFLYVFLFTATLYTIATLMLLIIRKIVPKESILTREYQLGKLKTRNRVVMPAILNGDIKAGEAVSGQITPEAIQYYAETAKGGTGLIYLSPAYISLSAKERVNQIGIHEDYTIPRLKEVVTECHEHGALMGVRLAHAGSYALRISDLKIEDPNIITNKEFDKILEDYVCAGSRAALAGFDIIELSAYMDRDPDFFAQLISPKLNTRNDDYGSSSHNRIKFPLEVIKAIKQNLPESVMLSFYISLPKHGISDEIIDFIKNLGETGIELLSLELVFKSISTPTIVNQIIKLREEVPSLPLVLNGTFDVSSAETFLKKGQADFIGLGHMIQKDKSFPHALK